MSAEIWKSLPSVKITLKQGWVKVYEAVEHGATIILDSNEGVGAWYGEEAPTKEGEKGISCKEGDFLEVPKGNTIWLKTFRESSVSISITQKKEG